MCYDDAFSDRSVRLHDDGIRVSTPEMAIEAIEQSLRCGGEPVTLEVGPEGAVV
jgi:hypothetical protein